MINYNEINDFIIKVFNYYNGKINIINKAVLDINWANLYTCDAGGYSRLPNIVVINPNVIFRYYGSSEVNVKIAIIEAIIHELYHTDQLINYRLYVSDINYNKFIEYACEVQTAIYIAGHIQEICNMFGINIRMSNMAYNNCMTYWDLPGVKYQRRYYHDHIFMCIDNICNFDKEIVSIIHEFIKYNIETKSDIIININNDKIYVCFNNKIMNIDEFNNAIIKYTCTGIHTVKHEFIYNKDLHELVINIKTEVLNLMCKKV